MVKTEKFTRTWSLTQRKRKEWQSIIEDWRNGNRVDAGYIKQMEETRTLPPHLLIADLARYEDEMTSESKTRLKWKLLEGPQLEETDPEG